MHKTINRIINSIGYGLDNFPILALIGARQVGKTTLLKKLSQGEKIWDLENSADFELISRDCLFFLENQKSKKIIIDEAQLWPDLFKALRVFVDKNRHEAGQVVLSGSSSPELLHGISESLAGRVCIVEVDTLTLAEIEGKQNQFYEALKFKNPQLFYDLKCIAERKDWSARVWWGGYPEPLVKNDEFFKSVWCENYLKTYIDRDIRRLFPELEMEHYRRFIKLLANTSGEILNYAEWASSLGVSAPTIKKYLEIAEGTFLFRKYPSYHFHSTKRLVKAPKGNLRDTGLICELLRIERPSDLLSHPKAGALFEVFISEQIVKQLKNYMIKFDHYYYRTSNGVEVDLILNFGAYFIPIEIKLGSTIRKESLKGIKSFMEDYSCPFGILINNGEAIIEIEKGIFQVPFTFI